MQGLAADALLLVKMDMNMNGDVSEHDHIRLFVVGIGSGWDRI